MTKPLTLKKFADKPGSILDAFSITGEHLGTLMVCHLPPVFDGALKNQVAVVIVKQALPIKYRSLRQPKGYVGLWADDTVVTVPA